MPHIFYRHACSSALFLMPLIFFCSCKKHSNTQPQSQTEVKATVTLSSGNTISINATGVRATITRDIYGYTYVYGATENNAGVNLMFPNITSPGTYSFICEYRVNTASTSTPIYTNAPSFVANAGGVTVVAVTAHHIEGAFVATCKTNSTATDSAFVSGSFKGDY